MSAVKVITKGLDHGVRAVRELYTRASYLAGSSSSLDVVDMEEENDSK
ncbi:MAG TPA: hypothetical protein VJT50_04935 [Pyrinomonadaceae bacterium]|nr:hypothetical protein [Pyrinomonadaceae bacterium]